MTRMERATEKPRVEALQAMDDQAWQALQDAYFRRVYYFVRRYIDDHQTAEDLTQEVFLGAVKGIERFDSNYTLDQFLFGIARNRVVDHFRKHKMPLIPAKGGDSDRSAIWLENLAESGVVEPGDELQRGELKGRQRKVLAQILRELVAELWDAGDLKKLMVLEYLFVVGGRNKDAAERFGIADEKAVAGIKFRAIDKLRGLARQQDPNHSLFLGLWEPGAR